jgi:hypothetical protein
MRKIILLIALTVVSSMFVSGQKKVDENIKTSDSFKEGVLTVTCEQSSVSGVCNYLIYQLNCEKPMVVDNKESVACTFSEIAKFTLKEKESETIPDLPRKPGICIKTDIIPTLGNCVPVN